MAEAGDGGGEAGLGRAAPAGLLPRPCVFSPGPTATPWHLPAPCTPQRCRDPFLRRRAGRGDEERDEEEEGEEEEVVPAETSLLNKLIRTSLVESSHTVEILQRDPSSPLYSIRTFEELPLKKELLQGIYMMGFNRPSKIQETALPMMLAYPPQNLIAQSQSGTGKTAAFVLAMLSRVNATEKYPQCLCLAPTYELALQIGCVIEAIGRFCADIRVTYAVRGNRVPRGSVLKEQIIIGTPGTMLDWCFKQKVVDLKKITLFVLDEADIMIDKQGLSSQSIRIQRALPKSCQMLLFSATFKSTVREFAEKIISNPIMIKLREDELTLSNIRQYYFVCRSREEKYEALCNIYGSITIGQAMIFCQTRRSADWLAVAMTQDGHQVAILTAELTVAHRANVIQRFRSGKEKVLIATNVCARGIDVQQVTIVVNFSLPTNQQGEPDFETYLHRIGRTGRFGKSGIAFSMVESRDVVLVEMIEEHFRKSRLSKPFGVWKVTSLPQCCPTVLAPCPLNPNPKGACSRAWQGTREPDTPAKAFPSSRSTG